MEKKINNPPAFPVPETPYGEGNEGMSLLDYFAGQAMQAIVTKLPIKITMVRDEKMDLQIAQGAYDYAKAMLIEREKLNE